MKFRRKLIEVFKWNNKLKVSLIVKRHLKTIYTIGDYDRKFISINDYSYFLVLPISICILLGIFTPIQSDYIKILIPFFAIFGGFLFNLNVFLLKEIDQYSDYNDYNTNRLDISRELYYNINFAVLLVFFLIIFCVFDIIVINYKDVLPSGLFKTIIVILSIATYFLFVQFMLTVLMVIRRIFLLFGEKFDSIEKKQKLTADEDVE